MKITKILSMILALAMILSMVNIFVASADSTAYVLFASKDGTGTGASASSPMSFANAQTAIADGGTIYVIGEVGDSTNTNGESITIGVDGKTINYVGFDDAAALCAYKFYYTLGKVSFENIEFKVTEPVSDLGIIFQQSKQNDITFKSGVVLPEAWAKNTKGFLMAQQANNSSTNNITIDDGVFSRIYAGGYNNGQYSITSNIVMNGGSASMLAVSFGSSKAQRFHGKYNFEINDGATVTNLILGRSQYVNGGAELDGVVTATINGGTVDLVKISSNSGGNDTNSTGVRVLTVNGGTIGNIKAEGKGGSTYTNALILNNGVTPTYTSTNINTIISAAEGIKVSAVIADEVIKGYTIEVPEGYYPLIDNVAAVADAATGLYSIGTGTHTVTVEAAPEVLYASADGTGDGSSADVPMNIDSAFGMIADGGTVYVVGTIGTTDDIYSLGSATKAMNIVGYGDDATITAGGKFRLAGKVSFSNLIFTTTKEKNQETNAEGDEEAFGFVTSAYNDVTFGENVTLKDLGTDGWIVPYVNDSNNTITVNSGAFSKIMAGARSASCSGVDTKIYFNGGSATELLIAHGWTNAANGNRVFDGYFDFVVNGGTVDKITLGSHFGYASIIHGTAKAIVNGGTVDTINMTSMNAGEIKSTALRIAEINGGTVNKITARAITDGNTKSILIFNNGMADNVSSIDTAYIDTVIKVAEGGHVSAVTSGKNLKGYTIDVDNGGDYVLLNGAIITPNADGYYTIPEGKDNVITFTDSIPLPEDLQNTLYRLKYDKELSVGYLGGSVTVGYNSTNTDTKSWRALTRDWFKTNFPEAAITEVSAPISGTGISYGLYRAEADYFAKNDGVAPDINFIEFAINDVYDGISTMEKDESDNYTGKDIPTDKQYIYVESLVRKIYESNPYADIVFVITGDEITFAAEEGSEDPIFGTAYSEIAGYYGIPVVYAGHALANDSSLSWESALSDSVHPNDKGHAHYASTIINYLANQLPTGATIDEPEYITATDKGYLDEEYFYCLEEGISTTLISDATMAVPTTDGFENLTDSALNGFTLTTDKGRNTMISENADESFTFEFNASEIAIWTWSYGNNSSHPNGTDITYTIDGGEEQTLNIYRAYDNYKCYTLAEGLAEGTHEITITHANANSPLNIFAFMFSGISGDELVATALTYKEHTDRITWIDRAQNLISTVGDNFTEGLDEFVDAINVLKRAEDTRTDLIDYIKGMWNKLVYTVDGETVTPKLYEQGDLNGDEEVNILDLIRAKKALAGVEGTQVEDFTLDMNSDGNDDTNDLALLKKDLLFQ